jgi:broad specificity phosphatase PhoE
VTVSSAKTSAASKEPFRPRNGGGKSLDEVQTTDPEGVFEWLANADAAPHGGESIAKLLLRVRSWLAGQQNSGHIVAISHPTVIHAAIVDLLDAPAQSFWRVEIPPLSITDLRWSGAYWRLRSSGCPLSVFENQARDRMSLIQSS